MEVKAAYLHVFVVASLAISLLAGCGEADKTKPTSQEPTSSIALLKKPAQHKVKAAKTSSPDPPADEASKGETFEKVDWGQEVTLDEIIAMAKNGRIQVIEWHVMPNIIRVLALDGRIFHLRNENKGVDMRNTLINAGIRIGKGGIDFRHVF